MSDIVPISLRLSKDDTNAIKGIAIIAMLMHHVWGCVPSPYPEYTGWLGFLGESGKVCVALFLFCSGYGLSAGYRRVYNPDLRWIERVKVDARFLAKRLLKFYTNYWVVFLIFVPLSVFVFNRPLQAAYGEHVNLLKRLILDVMGLQGLNSYNVTWWFNKLILIFYILFPVFWKFAQKNKLLLLGSSIICLLLTNCRFPGYLPLICQNLVSFVLGIVWNSAEGMQIPTKVCKLPIFLFAVITFFIVVSLLMIRHFGVLSFYSGGRIDFLITACVVLLVLICDRIQNLRVFQFLGAQSGNIYLIHTFFYAYWFPKIVYSRYLNQGSNLLLVLFVCVCCGICLNCVSKSFYAFMTTRWGWK